MFLMNGKNTNDDPKDLSDLKEQRQVLEALLLNFEPAYEQKTEVHYNQALRISQIFQIGPQVEKPKYEQVNSQDTSVTGKIKSIFGKCCAGVRDQKKKYQDIKQILFCTLKGQQFDWLQTHYKNYSHKQLGQLKSKYKEKMQFAISDVRFKVENHKVDQRTKQSTMSCIKQLDSIYEKALSDKTYFAFLFLLKTENESLFVLMISAYQVFKENYTPYKRSVLKRLFCQLQMQTFNNSIEVLRFLESKDPEIKNLPTISQSQLTAQVINNIQIHEKNKKYDENTDIGLVKVSESNDRRRVVNLLISGFLSEDKDKKQQWNQLLACMPDSQVYGLQWKSDTINRLVKFIALSIKDIITGKDVNDLLTKDNPFIPAFQVACKAGQQLAYVVHMMFPTQFINIISYSLGSELIQSFVRKTIALNGGRNLNKVVMMGGVTDVKQFEETLRQSEHSISVMNVRTKHDSILKHILKLAKPKIIPVGLNALSSQVGNHMLHDLDVSDKIKGHFSFMSNFGTIANLIHFNEE